MELAVGGRGGAAFGSAYPGIWLVGAAAIGILGKKFQDKYALAFTVTRSASSNLSPVIGSVPFSFMYFKMSLLSYTWPDLADTTGS